MDWKDKWQKDQYNERNPGQRNHPDTRSREEAARQREEEERKQPPAPQPKP